MNYEDLPYAIKGYPEKYDETYIENPITLAHAQYELSLVEHYHKKLKIISWCDAACGTGWHIRNSSIKKPKTGVDREKNMIDHAKKIMPFGPQWIVSDINDVPEKLGTFDLVTHFWYGYIHQKTLSDVHKIFLNLAKSVSTNGMLIVSICDPIGWSKIINHTHEIVFDNNLYIDSVIWRHKNPFTNTYYADCIAPHPTLIKEWLEPYFKEIETITYPKSAESTEWQKYGYLCKNRNNKDI